MNVVVLNTEFPSSAWRREFADALIRLRPELNPDVADELSDSAYLRLAEVEPCRAAARFKQDGVSELNETQSAERPWQGRAR